VFETVIGGIHGHRSEAHAKREERLRDGGVPNCRLQDLVPRGIKEEDDAVYCSVQSHRPY